MSAFPTISEMMLFIFATSLVLLWYASIQLLVSSIAKDVGSAVTLGVGTWLLFTMIWLLITALLATLLGVDATDTNNSQFALAFINILTVADRESVPLNMINIAINVRNAFAGNFNQKPFYYHPDTWAHGGGDFIERAR